MGSSYIKEYSRTFGSLSRSESFSRHFFTKFFNFIFKNPPVTFTLLIIIGVALFLFLYLKDQTFNLNSRSVDINSEIVFSGCESKQIEKGEEYKCQFNIDGKGLDNLSFEVYGRPDWLSLGDDIFSDQGNGNKYLGNSLYGSVVSDGKWTIGVLTTGKKSVNAECNDCDYEGRIFSFREFTLTTEKCTEKKGYFRNPLSGECEEFGFNCLGPENWKSYTNINSCTAESNGPEVLTSINDEEIALDLCDENSTRQYELAIASKDIDGDIVRYSIVDPSGKFELVQKDPGEVFSANWDIEEKFEDKIYEATINSEFINSDIGKTFLLRIMACDGRQKCVDKNLNISVTGKLDCISANSLFPSILYPYPNSALNKSSEMIWHIKNLNENTGQKVEILDKSCSNIIKEVDLNSVRKEEDIFFFPLIDQELNIGDYCLRILSRENENQYWLSDQIVFELVDNKYEFPAFPANIDISTNENISLELNPNSINDITYVLEGDSWLRIENDTLSGSTLIPGSYYFVIKAQSGSDTIKTKTFNINVNPPENTKSEIQIIDFKGMYSSKENTVNWQANDMEGVSSITVGYMKEGKTELNKIAELKSTVATYNWDVSTLQEGFYRLVISVEDNSQAKIKNSFITERTYIIPDFLEKEPEIIPSVVSYYPSDRSQTYSLTPTIGFLASFQNPDSTIPIEKLKIYLDDNEISNSCIVKKNSVECLPENDLKVGNHTVKFQKTADLQLDISENIYFEVLEIGEYIEVQYSDEKKPLDQNIKTNYINFLNLKMNSSIIIYAGIILIVALILIGVPWAIYLMWLKKEKRKGQNKTNDLPPVVDLPPLKEKIDGANNLGTALPATDNLNKLEEIKPLEKGQDDLNKINEIKADPALAPVQPNISASVPFTTNSVNNMASSTSSPSGVNVQGPVDPLSTLNANQTENEVIGTGSANTVGVEPLSTSMQNTPTAVPPASTVLPDLGTSTQVGDTNDSISDLNKPSDSLSSSPTPVVPVTDSSVSGSQIASTTSSVPPVSLTGSGSDISNLAGPNDLSGIPVPSQSLGQSSSPVDPNLVPNNSGLNPNPNPGDTIPTSGVVNPSAVSEKQDDLSAYKIAGKIDDSKPQI